MAPLDDGVPEGIQGPGEGVLQAEELPAVPVELEFESAQRPLQARRRRPDQPTAAEREEHERLHEPFRAWCRSCVAGRARADWHVARGRDDHTRTIPVIGVDYGYLWKRAGEEPEDEAEDADPPADAIISNPLLCGRNSRDRWIFGHLLLHKGNNDMNRELLSREILAGGYPRQIIRSDGEAPMVARVTAACYAARITAEGTGGIREQVSKGQWAGDDLAEGAVKEAEAKVRTMWHAAESETGRVIHTGVS